MNEVHKPYDDFILYAEDGSIGAIHHIREDDKIWVGDHVHVIKSSKVPNPYIYYLLSGADVNKYITGSVIQKLNNGNLKRITLKIPKDKSLIEELQPGFNELEQLQKEVRVADETFKQYIEDLRVEALVE